MAQAPPTVYLLYGDNDLEFSAFVDRLRSKMGDPSTADMNTERFSAENMEVGKLEQVCASLPFLTRRRLVIVENPTLFLKSPEQKERIYELLQNLPESTALLLIETVDLKSSRGRLGGEIAELVQWLNENIPEAYVQRFEVPHGTGFTHWIEQHANELGGQIEPQAARLLGDFVAEDVHTAHQELVKLLDYVDHKRPIEMEDVEKLTPFHGQSDVFALVDAIGLRDGTKALYWMRRLLSSDSPIYAFSMIVRQFRLIFMAKEAQENQQNPNDVLKIHPYAAEKIISQSRNFSLEDLERIYHHLLEMDVASKTGEGHLEVSLERFVASLTH
ncbi:MAG: DNA polymerase III subunit delta [Anaerolineales bacterium]|nr:DNA polymerase III subunit delta [Anaerolineales bacterium]